MKRWTLHVHETLRPDHGLGLINVNCAEDCPVVEAERLIYANGRLIFLIEDEVVAMHSTERVKTIDHPERV